MGPEELGVNLATVAGTPRALTPIARACRACGSTFVIDTLELAWWAELAAREPAREWTLPHVCTWCRAERRRARLGVAEADAPDEWLTCVDCGASFVFGGRDRQFFAVQGFAPPRRCRPCRTARQSATIADVAENEK